MKCCKGKWIATKPTVSRNDTDEGVAYRFTVWLAMMTGESGSALIGNKPVIKPGK